MALNQAQIDEAQKWITGQGLGTLGPNGINLTGGEDSNAAWNVAGAGKAKGYGADDLAQILGGGYTGSSVAPWMQKYQPQIDAGAALYNHDNPGATGGGSMRPEPAGRNLGFGGGSANPYLSGVQGDVVRRSNQALDRSLNGIKSQYSGVGGLGGSRQGVAQALAIQGAQDSLQGNLASMGSADWNAQQGRDLSKYGMDQNYSLGKTGQDNSYALGLGTLALGNRNTDLSAVNTGFNLYNGGNAGYLGQGQGLYTTGTTQQQAPWQVVNSTTGAYSPFTGYGATNTGTATSGGGATGAVGGALAGNVLGRNLGFGGGGNGYDSWQLTGNGMPSWYGG